MRLLALLLLIGTAHAQGLTTLAPGATGGGKVLWSAPFATPGCYASGQTAGASSAIAVTRTTSATYVDGAGAIQTCTTGQFRVAPDGLLVEPARTQYVLNATTHPKAAQATGSLSTGAHVAWHIGPGTMTLAAGTATVTGLSCTAVAAGTLCSFTVTVAGTMAITTEAGVTHAQVENGAYRTSFIASAGTAVARNADQVSATVPAVPSKWCIAVTAKPEEGRAWNTQIGRVWSMADAGSRETYLMGGASFNNFIVTDGAGGVKQIGYTAPASAAPRFIACNTAGALSLSIDGALTGTLSGAGTGVSPTYTGTLALGKWIGGDASQFGGFLKSLKICSARKPGECK